VAREIPIEKTAMINYVIFDMDGTLFDTEKLYRKTWIEIGEKWGFENMAELYPQVVGRSRELIIELMRSVYGEDHDYTAFFAERTEYFRSLTENEIPLKAGCFEILEFLKDNGIPCAVATSTKEPIASQNLKRAGVYGYFEAIVSGDMIERGKPFPDIFLKAGELLGADPNTTAVCEDSYNGLIGAHKAEMKPIMVIDLLEPTDEIKPITYAINDTLFDVIDLIKKENNI
jgi:HAD superfamily hydrolase (TIGR01509 family)